MKIYVVAALLMFAASAAADEAADARVAQLEARIKTLEQQVRLLTARLDTAATAPAAGLRPPRRAAPVEAPASIPASVIEQQVRQTIQHECIQRQVYEHAIGGPSPNYVGCQ
jgi:hypothetical protein